MNLTIGDFISNEEQIITGYPIDGTMGSSGEGWVRKLLDVCLHNNAIVARGILVTNIALWDTRTDSVPSILLVFVRTSLFTLDQIAAYIFSCQ